MATMRQQQQQQQQQQQATTQLEFHQAMADFKTMFPAMDDDVIEAVLRSNQGAVDATIDQLLSMTTDNENDMIRHRLETDNDISGLDMSSIIGSSDGRHGRPNTESTDVMDLIAVDNKDGATGNIPSASSGRHQMLVTGTSQQLLPQSDIARGVNGSLNEDIIGFDCGNSSAINNSSDSILPDIAISAGKVVKGNISPSSTPSPKMPVLKLSKESGVISMNQNEICDKTGTGISNNDAGGSGSVNSTPLRSQRNWVPPLLGPLPDDFLRLTPIHHSYHIAAGDGKGHGSPAVVAGFNRPQTECELEDARIALFLQNEEFMAELRWNKDFLLMLDKDSPPEERLSNFPPNRSSNSGGSGDEDAIFKERLKNMGKMSRKKFSQLARVFTGRKKRSSAKQILTQGPAPSRDNLLLHEDDNSDSGP